MSLLLRSSMVDDDRTAIGVFVVFEVSLIEHCARADQSSPRRCRNILAITQAYKSGHRFRYWCRCAATHQEKLFRTIPPHTGGRSKVAKPKSSRAFSSSNTVRQSSLNTSHQVASNPPLCLKLIWFRHKLPSSIVWETPARLVIPCSINQLISFFSRPHSVIGEVRIRCDLSLRSCITRPCTAYVQHPLAPQKRTLRSRYGRRELLQLVDDRLYNGSGCLILASYQQPFLELLSARVDDKSRSGKIGK